MPLRIKNAFLQFSFTACYCLTGSWILYLDCCDAFFVHSIGIHPR